MHVRSRGDPPAELAAEYERKRKVTLQACFLSLV